MCGREEAGRPTTRRRRGDDPSASARASSLLFPVRLESEWLQMTSQYNSSNNKGGRMVVRRGADLFH
eukprot:1195808-Pyramimonas_sp.AAC.1